jgi:hypothetical protein
MSETRTGASMNPRSLLRYSDFECWIEPAGQMRVPGIIYADEQSITNMDEKVREQLTKTVTCNMDSCDMYHCGRRLQGLQEIQKARSG